MPSRPPVHGAVRRQREAKATREEYDARRGTSAERGYDHKWRKARLGYLRKHPLCVHCQAEGRVTAANVVDHIIPHKGDPVLFWLSATNWQSLCAYHHGVKTATEDSGFARRLPETRRAD